MLRDTPPHPSRTSDGASLCPGHQRGWRSGCEVRVKICGVGGCVYVRQRRFEIIVQGMYSFSKMRQRAMLDNVVLFAESGAFFFQMKHCC